jgi:choline dehydrogenase-like flavoprotein
MFVDGRKLSTGTELLSDVCIVGAGPAGITLAKEFIDRNFKVCLLEGGGIEYDDDAASLCDGETAGDPFPSMRDVRRRQFGGLSNAWTVVLHQHRVGVRYVDFDSIDFEKRDWVPYSGWPITKQDLIPYYERAHEFCQLGSYDYSTKPWETETTPRVVTKSDRISSSMFKFGPSKIFNNEYRKEIEKARNITTIVNADVVEIDANETAQTIERVDVACLTGTRFSVRAKIFILAAGGTENARLMLLSNSVQSKGIGNQNDVVGRYFMDHPIVYPGHLYPADNRVFHSMGLYDKRRANGEIVMGKFTLSESVMRREKLLHNCAMLFPRTKSYKSDGKASAKALFSAVRHGKVPSNFFRHIKNIAFDGDDLISDLYQYKIKREAVKPNLVSGEWSLDNVTTQKFVKFELTTITEQTPHPDNRVTLSRTLDRLGYRQVKLTNYWNEIDKESMNRANYIYTKEFADAGLGRLKIEPFEQQEVSMSSHHNMGTTRMCESPKFGVVDADCKVHGISNLFIAGSSVFPTGGFANPTLTIIALAMRLADHLKNKMKR